MTATTTASNKILVADNRSFVFEMWTEVLQIHGLDLKGVPPFRFSDNNFPRDKLVRFPFGPFEIHFVQDIEVAQDAIRQHSYRKCLVSDPIGGGFEIHGGLKCPSLNSGYTFQLVRDLLSQTQADVVLVSKYNDAQYEAVSGHEDHFDVVRYQKLGRLKVVDLYYPPAPNRTPDKLLELIADELRCMSRTRVPANLLEART